ncbi:MAG: arginase family protein [Pseudomonadota bacterium]
MKAVEIISAPYHGGVRADRVGAGPERLLDMGLTTTLRDGDRPVHVSDLGDIPECDGEIGRAFEVKRRVSRAVSEAVRLNRFPLVLAGNCNVEVGTYAGLGSPDVPTIWFDGHTDFYTPDDITHGYFDSMGAATLTGQCWQAFAKTVPGFEPLSLRRLFYCGSRHLEVGLLERLATAGVQMVRGDDVGAASFAQALDAILPADRGQVLIHLDMDCIDTKEGSANEFAEPGGLTGGDLLDCLDVVVTGSKPLALTAASYDPSQPGADRIGDIAISAINRVVRALD